MADDLELKVNFADYDTKYMLKTTLLQRASKPKPDPNNPSAPPQSIQYHELPLNYSYTVKDRLGRDAMAVGPLAIEGPEMTSNGIIEKPSAYGGTTASLFTKFPLTDPAMVAFVSQSLDGPGTLERLYRYCLQQIFELRMGVPTFARLTSMPALEGVFGYPIHWERSTTTGEIVAGSSPSKYWQLICWGKEGQLGRRETLFTYPIMDPETRSWMRERWDVVRTSVIKYRPLITATHIYIGGGKASLQIKVTSAVITSIIPLSGLVKQVGTLKQLNQDSELQQRLLHQISLLRKAGESKGDEGKRESPALEQKGPSDLLMPILPSITLPTPPSATPGVTPLQSRPASGVGPLSVAPLSMPALPSLPPLPFPQGGLTPAPLSASFPGLPGRGASAHEQLQSFMG